MSFHGFVGYIGLFGMSLVKISICFSPSIWGRVIRIHSLCQWAKYKLPLWDTDMWDVEPLMIHCLILIQENIEINVPWPFLDQLPASQRDLDVLKLIQQLQGLQSGLDLFRVSSLAICLLEVGGGVYPTYFAHAIDEPILFGEVHGLCLPQTASPLDADASRVHLTAGLLDLGNAIAKIASQGDVRRPGWLGTISGHLAGTVYPDRAGQGVWSEGSIRLLLVRQPPSGEG